MSEEDQSKFLTNEELAAFLGDKRDIKASEFVKEFRAKKLQALEAARQTSEGVA